MLGDTLRKLSDAQQPLSHKLLRTLSGLDRVSLAAMKQAWSLIPAARRQQIATALVEMAEDDVDLDFVDVLRLLLTDGDPVVRASAVSGLWETTDPTLVDPLITLLHTDPASAVREAVAEVLGHFAMLAADERRETERSKRLLTALLHTFRSTAPLDTAEVRRNALESAAQFSDDERVIAAIREAYKDANLTIRSAAISAMGIAFDDQWHEIVLKELDSPEPEMRFVAARAAGELWLQAAVPRLAAMTRDRDHEVRLMAISSLGEVGGLHARATLTEMIESNDESIRDAAEEALEELRFNENPLDFADMFVDSEKPGGKNKQ